MAAEKKLSRDWFITTKPIYTGTKIRNIQIGAKKQQIPFVNRYHHITPHVLQSIPSGNGSRCGVIPYYCARNEKGQFIPYCVLNRSQYNMVGDFGGGVPANQKMYTPGSNDLAANALFRELCEETSHNNQCGTMVAELKKNGIAAHLYHQISSPHTMIYLKEEICEANPAHTQKNLRFNVQLFVEVKWETCRAFLDTFRGNKEVTEVIIVPYPLLREYIMEHEPEAMKFEVLRDLYEAGRPTPALGCDKEEEKVDAEFCTGKIKVIPYNIPYAKNAYQPKGHKKKIKEEKKVNVGMSAWAMKKHAFNEKKAHNEKKASPQTVSNRKASPNKGAKNTSNQNFTTVKSKKK
jgi:hypothetical protein